jgi:hypothetical protein
VSAGSDEGALLRGYLLATLPEPDRLDLAARYFGDDELFERLEAAEAELIDAYVAGELSETERQRFEETLTTFPGRSDRVAFARALRAMPPATVGQVPRRSAPSAALGALAAALAVAAIGGIWVARRTAGYEAELRSLRAERDRLASSQRDLSAELERLRERLASVGVPGTAGPVGRTVTFFLTAGLTRGAAGGNLVRIPSEAALVRLELPVAPPLAARYRARLEHADGGERLRRDGLIATRTAGAPVVVFDVDAAALPAGDYVLFLEDLSGSRPEPLEEFSFRIVR